MSDEEIRNGITLEPEIVKSLKVNSIVNVDKYVLPSSLDTASPEKFFYAELGVVRLCLDNGDVISFAEDSVKESIVCWFDEKDGLKDCASYYDDGFWVNKSIDDVVYGDQCLSSKLLGTKINSIHVFKSKDKPLIDFPDSNERAIVLSTDRGSVALTDNSLTIFETDSVALCNEADLCASRLGDHLKVDL